MASDVLRLLANRMNRDILGVLAVEASFPRRIAALLGYAESEVSRRLRAMEKTGLLTASWQRHENNVKIYALARNRFEMRIAATGITLEGLDAEGQTVPSTPAMPVPATSGFVGRGEVLQQLDAVPVTVLEGLPGIGKTSLLSRFAEGKDPLWITCRGAESLTWIANQAALHLARKGDRRLLDAVEAGAGDAALSASMLEGMDVPGAVTVIDDAHNISDPGARGFLDDAFARFSQGRLLVAGRARFPHAPRQGVQSIRLGGLDDAAAKEFLHARGFEIDDTMLARVRDEVGGHPLALHLLAEAASTSGGLEPLLDRKPERELTDYLLEEIDEGLTDGERTALGHAALFRYTFQREELETLCSRRLDAPLLALRRRNLVLGDEEGMRLHEVVRNFFYSRLQDKARLHGKAAEQCLARGTIAGHLEAMHHLLQAGDRDAVLELLAQDMDLRDFDFIDSGYHRLYRDVLDRFGRQDVTDDALWAQVLDERGDLEFHAGEPDAALDHYGEAAALFEEAGDAARCADLAWKRALCLEALGCADEARDLCDRALETVEDATTRGRLERLRERLPAVTA